MNHPIPPIVLASASPRRLQILQLMGLQVDCHPADIDETPLPAEPPRQYVQRLATGKAMVQVKQGFTDRLVLGADTIIEHQGGILGKPANLAESIEMLRGLSGSWHSVLTGVALMKQGRVETCLCETAVKFTDLDDSDIESYWATGEPAGKAGSYAIQGAGALFVQRIEGSYSNVVGLPVFETATLLSAFGVTTQGLLSAIASSDE